MSTIVDLKKPIMPKATAVWLIDNTTLTFKQIGGFTDIHPVEIQSAADGDIWHGIVGRNPIEEKLLPQEEIDKAQKDSDYQMNALTSTLPPIKTRSKGPKYTPVAKRRDKPDAISFLIKNHPEITDAQICKLVGTTKPTILAIRERTHANIVSIKPQNPIDLGICTHKELEVASHKGLRALGRDPIEEARQREEEEAAQREADAKSEEESQSGDLTGFDFSNFMNS